jgi:UPF0755 protein
MRNFSFWVLGIFLILAFFLIFLSAPETFPKGTIINIGEGESLRSVSFQFKEKHLIRSRIAFEAFVILYGGEKHIIPADYFFENNLPVFELARRISKGERHLAPIKITLPEGFDVGDMVKTFAAKLSAFNENNFLLKAKEKEGYLFPDTYFFFTNADENDALKALTDNYEKKIKPLRPEIFSSGKNEKDIIIMASLIEREAKGSADRKIISGILWKRLRIGMLLQVDTAPETYKNKGLPKNPIANPGLEAIYASIHPQTSTYLYYLHDKMGVVHYADSFGEHIKNKLKYL